MKQTFQRTFKRNNAFLFSIVISFVGTLAPADGAGAQNVDYSRCAKTISEEYDLDINPEGKPVPNEPTLRQVSSDPFKFEKKTSDRFFEIAVTYEGSRVSKITKSIFKGEGRNQEPTGSVETMVIFDQKGSCLPAFSSSTFLKDPPIFGQDLVSCASFHKYQKSFKQNCRDWAKVEKTEDLNKAFRLAKETTSLSAGHEDMMANI